MRIKRRSIIVAVTAIAMSPALALAAAANDASRLLPAPIIHAAYPTMIVWKWHHQNPYRWNVHISLDGGATYIMPDDYWHYGDSRRFAPDGGSEYTYIVGVDKNGREVTRRSNAVRPDDAKVPKKI